MAALTEYYKDTEPEFKTFVVWSRDPNKPTEEAEAGHALIVQDLRAVIQRDAAMWFASGDVQWPENVPAREWWFQLLIDKGGGSTKVLLKHVCMHRADSVRRCTVVGILDKTKDTHENMLLAFGELFAQFNEINRAAEAGEPGGFIDVGHKVMLPMSAEYKYAENGKPVPVAV